MGSTLVLQWSTWLCAILIFTPTPTKQTFSVLHQQLHPFQIQFTCKPHWYVHCYPSRCEAALRKSQCDEDTLIFGFWLLCLTAPRLQQHWVCSLSDSRVGYTHHFFFSSSISPLARAKRVLFLPGFSGGAGITPACPSILETASLGCTPTESQYLTYPQTPCLSQNTTNTPACTRTFLCIHPKGNPKYFWGRGIVHILDNIILHQIIRIPGIQCSLTKISPRKNCTAITWSFACLVQHACFHLSLHKFITQPKDIIQYLLRKEYNVLCCLFQTWLQGTQTGNIHSTLVQWCKLYVVRVLLKKSTTSKGPSSFHQHNHLTWHWIKTPNAIYMPAISGAFCIRYKYTIKWLVLWTSSMSISVPIWACRKAHSILTGAVMLQSPPHWLDICG